MNKKLNHPDFGYVIFENLTPRQVDVIDFYKKFNNKPNYNKVCINNVEFELLRPLIHIYYEIIPGYPNESTNMVVRKSGRQMKIITDGVPDDLYQKIDAVISEYCNH